MKRIVLPLLVLILAALLPIAVVAQANDTLVVRGFGNVTSFNPALANDGASYDAWSLIYPAPFKTDSFTLAAVPGLTSWTISSDGLRYTFTIRPDAVWSDGTPITSDDMIFPINAIMSPNIDTQVESAVEAIDHVNKIDDKTYEVVLKAPDCAVMSDLSGIRFMPSKLYAADFSDFLTNPENTTPTISGGPYILDSYTADESASFHANSTYWDGAPHIPFLVNKIIGDAALAVQAIQSDDIDYTYFHGDLFKQIADTSHLQYKVYPQLTVNFLAMNFADPTNPQAAYDADGNPVEQTPHPLFSDLAVRKAVAMGVNVDDFLQTLNVGDQPGGTPMEGDVTPAITWAYDNNIQRYPYDPVAAAQLLEDDGWVLGSDGVRVKDGVQLAFTITYSNILKDFETEALVTQDELSKIGFKVDVKLVEWATYLSDVFYGQTYDMTPLSNSGGTNTPDPNDFTALINSREDVPGSGSDTTSYVNHDVDALIDQARTVPGCDQATRAGLYSQITQKLHDDVAYNWTYDPNVFQVANSRIGNFNPGPAWVYYGYTSDINQWTINP